MNSRRKLLVTLGAGALAVAVPPLSLGQQPGKIWHVGFLAVRSRSTPSNPEANYDAFVDGMRELGYVEGRNLVIEWRFADGNYERLPGLAAELVRLDPDVIVTHASPGTAAMQHATGTIPIVAAAVGDPVARGFAATLAKPGGNITGTSNMDVDLVPKLLELLSTIVPGISRVAILTNPSSAGQPKQLRTAQAAALQYGVSILPVEARTPEEVGRGFETMRRERAEGVIVVSDAFLVAQRRQIVDLATRNRIPSISYYREDVTAGGLISYGPNTADLFRRAATYVDKILKGAKPRDLAIEQPTKLDVVINMKTAKALGLTVPQSLLLRADEVIQ